MYSASNRLKIRIKLLISAKNVKTLEVHLINIIIILNFVAFCTSFSVCAHSTCLYFQKFLNCSKTIDFIEIDRYNMVNDVHKNAKKEVLHVTFFPNFTVPAQCALFHGEIIRFRGKQCGWMRSVEVPQNQQHTQSIRVPVQYQHRAFLSPMRGGKEQIR